MSHDFLDHFKIQAIFSSESCKTVPEKMRMDMLKYAKDSIKNELSGLVKELEEIIENNLDINEQLIEKADIIVHKIRMDE
jgi:Ser-tRNA(Ala) deacylase AlaX